MPGLIRRQRPDVDEPAKEAHNTLLAPLQMGPFKLTHRVVMGPMTRCRSFGSIPQWHNAVYYSQRATPGGLLITEATGINPTSDGYVSSPGIWAKEQVDGWRKVVREVHRKGAFIFCQLCHNGRRSHTSFQPNGERPISSTSRRITAGKVAVRDGSLQDFSTPRAVNTDEIQDIIADFVAAAKNAIAAGFDGVELHGANGYLIDQFLKDGINDRVDKYGGSIENRSRFLLELARAVASAIGEKRVGVKLSPFSDFGQASDSNPTGLGVYIAEQLSAVGVLYVAFVEARIQEAGYDRTRTETVAEFRKAFRGVFLVGGGYNREEGIEAVKSGKADAVIYASPFLANPDLPKRFFLNAPLNKPNPTTFFSPNTVEGYTDYPFLDFHDGNLQFGEHPVLTIRN